MNYFVTHCDVNFLKYAERLFETISKFSKNKIIFYCVDFKYQNKFKNVIPITVSSNNFIKSVKELSKKCNIDDAIKAHKVFLKPFLIYELLNSIYQKDNNFCYLDADCLALKNCDDIFYKSDLIIDYPLFNKGCHDYMMMDGNGDPFVNGICDLKLTLESRLMNLLNIDLNLRKQYLQTGVFLFNSKCKNFIFEWMQTCSKEEVINDWQILAPFHEETVMNCLMWKKDKIIDLNQSLINLPYNNYDIQLSINKIKEMLNCLSNLKDEDYYIDTFCKIPSKININDLFFYHGKISDLEYDYIKQQLMTNYLLKINSTSLGDTLAVTPTLRKLYHCYNKKIDIVTYHPELFKNNKYVNKIYNFSDKINLQFYSEIFNTFLGVGGYKNEYGVEKKHNTIDIRQFHAIDLGFMLNENEMHYDYVPDEFINIEDLPTNYICLHVANTWPSRTYSDENWQKLINIINDNDIPIVLIGKNAHESGFYNIDKPTKKLTFKKGLDLTNKLNISQCWHVINRCSYFITMDSGLLHLAGTTDANIIQLGSSINNKLRAPYRNGSQDYKYKYIGGSCNLFCASDIKYGVKEWKTIQGIPPLINCLENKNTFECHPIPVDVFKYISTNTAVNKQKFLFITGHLSTGGSPKYLEWLISKKIKENYLVKVVEWNLYSDTYVIHRNSIINLVGSNNFYSVGHYTEDDSIFYAKTKDLIEKIKEFNPDFIHLNEFSENFAIKPFSKDIVEFLYNPKRNFKLFESTHSAKSNFLEKINIPDELWLVSDYQYEISKFSNIKSLLVEMEVPKKIRPNRETILKSLGLNPNKMHILQVGLFCNNKNQKFLFDLANKYLNSDVQFHFIGNTCYIDECDINKEQINCKIWGERPDVDVFMSCMDLFVMPSLEELNPIALKEALSWDMKCFVSNLPTIYNKYKDNKNVTFIDKQNLLLYIDNHQNNFKNKNTFKFNNFEKNDILCTFNPQAKINILGEDNCIYEVKFIDNDSNKVQFETIINNNMWCECSIKYFCNWKIIVTNITTGYEKIFYFDIKNKNIKIINDSSSLGDSISWMAVVDDFQKKNNCVVDYYTPKKDLFKNEYPNINFYDYSAEVNKEYYAQYKIGCFATDRKDLSKQDWRTLSLQGIACSILGIENKEIKSKISKKNKFKLNFNKYVCIATQSTSQSRYWNKENGWFEVVKYLKKLGYKVVCVDKHYVFGADKYYNTCPVNIDYFAGNHSFDEIIDIINNCEFFIGLSSGLSWVAWALEKKVIKINGSVSPDFEFKKCNVVFNSNVCNSCFNNVKHEFDSANWSWCPENKNFECTRYINEKDIINQIDRLIKF